MSQSPCQTSRLRITRRTFGSAVGLRFWIAVGAAVLIVAPAGCQRNGRRHHSVRNLSLYNRRGHVDLSLRYRENDRTPRQRGGREERYEELVLEESLALKTDGFVYHPTLFEFAAGAVLGLRQAEFEQTVDGKTNRSSDDGDIVEFDFSGTLLQRKPYPTTFYARRTRTFEPRPFRTSVETVSTGFGVQWKLVHDTTPIELQFDVTDIEFDPFIQAGEVEGRRENTTFRAHVAHFFSQHNHLNFRYTRETIKEEPLAFDYDHSEARLTHLFEFGEEHQHRLTSELRHQEQTGTFDTQRSVWYESLYLHHTDRLQTSYVFEASDRSQGSLSGPQSLDVRSYGGVFTLDHQLYDNLNTRFTTYRQNQEFDSGLDIRRRGWAIDFRYYRHNPWGVLRAGYRYGHDEQELTGGEQEFEVIEARWTFIDPEPLVLSDPNIAAGSILVLREDRTEIYRAGRDYRIRRIGDRIELERIITGRIADGETILLSYRYSIGGSYDLETVSHIFSLRQEFDSGWTPYYRLRQQDQSLRPADATGVADEDFRDHVFGVEFQRETLRLKAEYEDYQSTISPFKAIRLNLNYSRRLKSGGTGGVGAHWYDVQYSGVPARESRLLRLEANYLQPLTRDLSLEAEVIYRRDRDSLSGSDEGIEVDLTLEWLIRKTRIRVQYEYADVRSDFSNQKSTAVYVNVRRKF